MHMPTKIEDVAQRAGVSTATVSRVLSGKPYVSEDLRTRVLAAAQELDYRPSRVARSLREKRSRIIGLIISDIQNPFFTAIVRAVEDGAYASGHAVFLCNTDEDEVKETLYIDLMLAEQVAGVILSSTTGRNPAYNHLMQAGIPVVAIDRRVYNVPLDTVLVDNIDATRRAVEHLISQGHRRIGAIVGHLASSTGEERLRGYTDALMAHNIPVMDTLIRIGTPRAPVGFAAMNELLALPDPPTAVFTGNNLLTAGALRALFDAGLRVPEDVAVAAFDDMEWAIFIQPALTMVAQPTYEIGRIAVELLQKRIADPRRPPEEVILPAHVIARNAPLSAVAPRRV
jgi:DNA-binding LacI/PurR family transcriptional regulator